MADLAIQKSRVTGKTYTMSAATTGAGDTVPGGAALLVHNGSGSSINVTVAVPGNTKYGAADPDFVHAVAAGAIASLGPFPDDLVDPTDGKVHVTYSAVTSVQVAAVSGL